MSFVVPAIAAADLDPGKFRSEHVLQGLPLHIRGMAQPERVFSFREFLDEMSQREVLVCEYGAARGPKWQWSRYAHRYPLRLQNYVRMLEDGRASARDIYLNLLPMGAIGSAASARTLFDDFAARVGFKKLHKDMEGYLWIGPTGHVEPLHTDEGDNTLFQVTGTKRLAIFPPRQIHNLYPFPLFARLPPWVAQADIARPDYERFPRLREALEHRWDVVLEPGDMLYLPTQWSHEVTIVAGSPCISVTRQWQVAPWRRNFCTSRSTLWYLKRHIPRRPLMGAYAMLAALRKPADAMHFLATLRRDQNRKTRGH